MDNYNQIQIEDFISNLISSREGFHAVKIDVVPFITSDGKNKPLCYVEVANDKNDDREKICTTVEDLLKQYKVILG